MTEFFVLLGNAWTATEMVNNFDLESDDPENEAEWTKWTAAQTQSATELVGFILANSRRSSALYPIKCGLAGSLGVRNADQRIVVQTNESTNWMMLKPFPPIRRARTR